VASDAGRRLTIAGAAAGVAALILAVVLAASVQAAPGARTLTLWTVANGAQYLNNGDDRGRGIHINPLSAAQSKLKPKSGDNGEGPYPGDVGVFTLTLYANAKLQKIIGSGAYTCYYNYDKNALCEAYYQLNGNADTLLSSGLVNFNNTARFKLIITGGTNKYRDARGELSAAPAGRAERVDVTLLPPSAPSSGSTSGKTTVVYAVANSIQFINHEDDRRRGMTNNPFEVKRAKDLKVVLKGSEKKNGPFPGDDVLYTFKLYKSSNRAKQVGSAVFTCYYDVKKHATCEAYFGLSGASLFATGSVVFNSTKFTLSLDGGTDQFLGIRGEIASIPAANESQRFDLKLE